MSFLFLYFTDKTVQIHQMNAWLPLQDFLLVLPALISNSNFIDSKFIFSLE